MPLLTITQGIIQDDPKEKHSQISKMHEIYSAAYATIVQQSGSDANNGLPGVVSYTRSTMALASENIAPRMVAIPRFDLQFLLQTSIHSSRGWTMQEVLLSHRCIHFFDKHATFLCAQRSFHDFDEEPVWLPELSDEDENGDIPSTNGSGSIPWQMNPLQPYRIESRNGPESQLKWLEYFEIYARIIFSYSRRKLSYQSDILAAFSGLSTAISQLTLTEFALGMPVASFDLALLWIPLEVLGRREDVYYENKNQRLPSWTWAAWSGRVSYNLCATSGPPSFFKQFNSYIKRFSIEGFTTHVERRSWPSQSIDGNESGLFELYKRIDDPQVDRSENMSQPIGCLHFWSEEVSPGDIIWKLESLGDHREEVTDGHIFPFLYVRGQSNRCGILALPPDPIFSGESGQNMTFVLLSECRDLFRLWPPFNGNGGLQKLGAEDIVQSFYKDGYDMQFALNVLLVRRTGHFVERIAFGQVHLAAWIRCSRRRRYFRMI